MSAPASRPSSLPRVPMPRPSITPTASLVRGGPLGRGPAAAMAGCGPLLVGLTVVTGLVDAVSYLALGHVFVANMTGNVVFLPFALAGAPGLSAPASPAALGAFLLGALAGGRIGVRFGEQRDRHLRTATTIAGLLVLLATLLAAAFGQPVAGSARYAWIVPLAIAMGIQNATARRPVCLTPRRPSRECARAAALPLARLSRRSREGVLLSDGRMHYAGIAANLHAWQSRSQFAMCPTTFEMSLRRAPVGPASRCRSTCAGC